MGRCWISLILACGLPAASEALSEDDCPWLSSSGIYMHTECSDGSFCVQAGNVSCCASSTPARCPPERPYLCALQSCDGKHCCYPDAQMCEDNAGGLLECASSVAIDSQCPWINGTGILGTMQCADGTLCEMSASADPIGHCCPGTERASCPPEFPHMCAEPQCAGDVYCCEAEASHCDGSPGGLRPCPDFPTVGSPAVLPDSDCPWLSSSETLGFFQCSDGLFCQGSDSGDSNYCCTTTGIARCPPERPYMCQEASCDGKHCCSADRAGCDAAGGLRQCDNAAAYEEQCPWTEHTGVSGQLMCADGTLCEQTDLGDFSHCCEGIERSKCPPEWPHMCESLECSGFRCCAAEAQHCDLAGGLRPCPDFGAADASDVPALPNLPACPWLTSSGLAGQMECMDSTFCGPGADGDFPCCAEVGRARCPSTAPYMCAGETCSGQHCCVDDPLKCEQGLRPCEDLDAILEECPWVNHTTVPWTLRCSDGTLCEQTSLGDFTHCCEGLERASCPPEWPYMCEDELCGGKHCCSSEAWHCDQAGGLRPCPDIPVHQEALVMPDCPWLESSRMPGHLQCLDGSFCGEVAPNDYSDCCQGVGRARCPPDFPYMCNLQTCSGQHCCAEFAHDCIDHAEGLRGCDNGTEVAQHCPWISDTGVSNHILCSDGRLCEAIGGTDFSHCCTYLQRHQCSPEYPHMCMDAICAEQHCCTSVAANCDYGAGGLRTCPDFTGEMHIWCPWTTHTNEPGHIQCADGTLCEQTENGDYGHCCVDMGRARCPPEYPHMCNDMACHGQHCCSDQAAMCEEYGGGLRPCPDDTHLSIDLALVAVYCPWVSSSGVPRHLQCMNGAMCESETGDDYSHCCQGDARARCPPEFPYMCADPECGGQHCCTAEADHCEILGGMRSCEDVLADDMDPETALIASGSRGACAAWAFLVVLTLPASWSML